MTNVQVCQECEKMYSCKTYFEYHRTVQHSPYYLTCGTCQKHFPTKKVIEWHGMAHTRKSHSCNICGELQNSGLLLYVHLVTSHSAAPRLRCALCDRVCSNGKILKQHIELAHSRRISKLNEVAELCCTVHSARSFPEEDLELDVLLNQVRNREGDVRFEQNGSVAITNGAEPMRGGAHFARSQQNESKPIENRVEDDRFEQNGSVAITNGAVPKRGGAHFARSQQNESKPIENRVNRVGDVRFDQNGSMAITNGTESIRGNARSACFKQEEFVAYKVEPLWCGALSENSILRKLVLRKKATVQKTTPLAVVQSSSSSETKLIPPTRSQLPLRELNEQDPAQNSNKTSVEHPADIPTEIVHDAREDADELLLRVHSIITVSHELGRTVTTYACETCGMKSDVRSVFLKAHKPPDEQS